MTSDEAVVKAQTEPVPASAAEAQANAQVEGATLAGYELLSPNVQAMLAANRPAQAHPAKPVFATPEELARTVLELTGDPATFMGRVIELCSGVLS